MYENDPLIQYLKKEAKQLEDNMDDMKVQTLADAMQERDVSFEGTAAETKRKESDELLRSLFTNYPTEKTSKK